MTYGVISTLLFQLATLASPLPTPGMPDVLLHATNSRLIALSLAQVQSLHERGISGIVIEEPPGESASSGEKLPGTPEQLGSPLQAAVERLRKAGLEANFLSVSLAPGPGWFASRQPGAHMASRARTAAKRAMRLGLKGLAIDPCTDQHAKPFAYESYLNERPEELRQRALRTGRSVIKTIHEEHAEATILASIPPDIATKPLLFALVLGMLEGAQSTGAPSIVLLLEQSPEDMKLPALYDTIETHRRMLALHAGGAWGKSVGLGLHLQAEDTEGEAPAPEAIGIAKLTADAVTSIRLVRGNTPQIPSVLDSAAIADAARSPFNTPLDSYERAGVSRVRGHRCFILSGPEGGGAVPLEPGGNVWISSDTSGIKHVPLAGKGLQPEAEDTTGAAKTSPPHPVLVTGLAVSKYVTPACLWLEPLGQAPGSVAFPIRFGFVNRTAFPIKGRLDLVTEDTLAAHPATIPVDLNPGDEVKATGRIQGELRPGDTVSLRMVLGVQGGGAISRAFTVPVRVPENWRVDLLGTSNTQPLAVDLNNDGKEEYIACTSSGTVRAVSASGQVIWTRQLRGGVHVRPVAGRGSDGAVYIAVATGAQGIIALNASGQSIWERELESLSRNASLVPIALEGTPGSEFALATESGQVALVSATNERLWAYDTGIGNPYLVAVDVQGGFASSVAAAGAGEDAKAVMVDRDGELLWARDLSGVPECAPVIGPAGADGQSAMVFAYSGGEVELIDAATGASLQHGRVDGLQNPAGLAVTRRYGEEPVLVAVATPSKLLAFTSELEVAWEHDLQCTAPPVAFVTRKGPRLCVPTADRTLRVFDPAGKQLFASSPAAAFVRAAPLLVQDKLTGEYVGVYTSQDHFMRAFFQVTCEVIGALCVEVGIFSEARRPWR